MSPGAHRNTCHHLSIAYRLNPDDPRAGHWLVEATTRLADLHIATHDHAAAAALATDGPTRFPDHPGLAALGAEILVGCIRALEDAVTDESECRRLQDDYARQATTYFRHAIALGEPNLAGFLQSDACAPLRACEEFQDLLEELGAQ